jgi:hypothetical protein
METPEQRKERLRQRELKRQKNREAWRKNPEVIAAHHSSSWYSDRYKGKLFSVDADPKVGVLHTYQEVVKGQMKIAGSKKTADEVLDTLLAAGKIFMFDEKELQREADREAPTAQLKDVEDIIRESGDKGITEEGIKLAMRARGWHVDGLPAPDPLPRPEHPAIQPKRNPWPRVAIVKEGYAMGLRGEALTSWVDAEKKSRGVWRQDVDGKVD